MMLTRQVQEYSHHFPHSSRSRRRRRRSHSSRSSHGSRRIQLPLMEEPVVVITGTVGRLEAGEAFL